MNSFIKQAIIIFITLGVGNKAYAQSNEMLLKDFYDSIYRNLVLKETPMFTVIKIAISKQGKLMDIQLSDSVESLFNKSFMSIKSALNWTSLIQYVKKNGIQKTSLLIPIYITDYNGNISPGRHTRGFMKFKNEEFVGGAIIFNPVEVYNQTVE